MNIFSKGNKLTSWSNIQMKADKTAELNISGFIGIPEWWQFDPDMEKELISTKEKMQVELKAIANLKVETIKVNIDSLGGDVNHGQAMFSALSKNPANIEVEYIGWSASIATIIAAAATDNNVSMSNTNMILIHKARGCQCGISNDMRSYAEMLDKVDNTMANVYAEQTGNTSDEMLEQMNVNNGDGEWLTANEAQELGLIKDIIEPMRAAASYDLNKLKEFGYKIPQHKLNNINMRFGKDKPINALAMQDDSILLHEGELKEGSELKTVGENENVEAGVYETKDGRKITVDANSKVTLIEEKKEPEPVTLENVVAQLTEVFTDMLLDSEKRINDKIKALREKGTGGIVPRIDNKAPEIITGSQDSAKIQARKDADKIMEAKRKSQGVT